MKMIKNNSKNKEKPNKKRKDFIKIITASKKKQ